MDNTNLKNPNALLQTLGAALNQHDHHKIGVLNVTFVCENGDRFEFGLPQALDAIANDLYWDERGNWADATHCTVDTF